MSSVIHRASVAVPFMLAAALACSPPSGADSAQDSTSAMSGAQAASVAVPDGEPEDPDVVYGLGLITAQTMSMLALSPSEREIFEQAIRDHREGNVRISLRDVLPRLDAFQKARLARAAELEREAATRLLEQAGQADGARVLTDAGGVVIQTLQAGAEDEAPPEPADAVELEFEISLRDGTVVDGSTARGGPQTWPVAGMLPCWRAALREMRPGAKASVVCPSETAYGATGKIPLILPRAAIRTELTLLSIKRGQAALYRGGLDGVPRQGGFH
jgi:FKBP-type peptidyl-prolyl cis-trans isomerase FkpA